MAYNISIKIIFSLFLGIGLFAFSFMAYLTLYYYFTDLNEFYKIAPATAILLSALIAATTIIRNANYNEELSSKIIDKDKNNKKILIKSHLKYFIAEADEQINAFKSILQYLHEIHDGTLNVTPFLYNEKMNENKIIKNLDYLLSPDLHKYSEQSTIDTILLFKAQVLGIMHDIQVITDAYIPNKQIEETRTMLNSHINAVHDMKLKLIVLQQKI